MAEMRKKILSVLLGCSLLFGTIFANAVSIEFEDIGIDDACITYEELETEDSTTEENIIQNINSPLATKAQSVIGIKNELYPETYDSEIETVEQSTVSQILIRPTLSRSFMSARMASTVIDLTDLAAGNEISHDCNLYLNTQYDTTQHWKECSVCGKKFSIINHFYKDNGWILGTANHCHNNNYHMFSCNCGYSYTNTTGRKAHSYGTGYNRQDYYIYERTCSECNAVLERHDCYKADGTRLTCTNLGTCRTCGYTYTSNGVYHTGIPRTTGATYCYMCGTYLCNVNSLGVNYITPGIVDLTSYITVPSGTTYSSVYHWTNNSNFNFTHSPYINGYNWSDTCRVTFPVGHQQIISTEKWFSGIRNGTVFNIKILQAIKAENVPPVINDIKQENLAYSDGWVTNQKLTISGTENYCGVIRISVEDALGNIYVNNAEVSVNNGNWSYSFYPAIEADETGLEFTVTVKDILDNTATKKFIEYKTDMKPPIVVSNQETTKEWSKTKDFTIDATDFGVGNVAIGFNDINEYQLAEQQDNNFVRPYTFTGDVYGSTVAAVYVKDSIGNTTTQFITVYNLDNTAPTITNAVSERQGTRNAIVTVTANDINTKLNASGSGITGYAITQEKNVPNECEFQSSNTFSLTKAGTWYVWVIDAVGNISKPVAVDVEIEYTVSLNTNGGILTGDSTYQIISGETITIPEPTRTGYTFTGWTVRGEGSAVNGNQFKMGSEDAEITAQWKINQYPVTYIDKTTNGTELGRTIKQVDYNSSVKGSDLGDSTADNAYYNQYRYVSDTSATVTTEGAVVYRVFEFCETEKESHLTWNDDDNADGLRPEKYTLKLKQNGKVIDEIELPSNQTDYSFDNLPKYDTEGNPYHYEIETIVSDRYRTNIDEEGNLIIEDYQSANFSVVIPKTIVLDGRTGNADYTVSVNGTFYYNDTLTVIPESSFTLTDRSKISSMQANVSQQKTGFTKEDLPSSVNGSIQVNRTYFSGSWQGNFNFDIKFVMQN